jgi:hypothetical protein
MSRDNFDPRRCTDQLIEQLIQEVREEKHAKEQLVLEVRSIKDDLQPIRDFMEQITAAKTAGMWIVGIIAAIGAAFTWALNVKDHFNGKLMLCPSCGKPLEEWPGGLGAGTYWCVNDHAAPPDSGVHISDYGNGIHSEWASKLGDKDNAGPDNTNRRNL